MKTLYLMRHGQTLFNIHNKIQGWCDSPLTKDGIIQAKIAAEYFNKNNIIFDHCYSSTAERACDTLELVTDNKYEYKRLKGLKEHNFGVFEGQDEFLHPSFPFGNFYVQFGGESDLETELRVNDTIINIMNLSDHNNVLMVSHAGAIAGFTSHWIKYSQIPFTPNMLGNCAIFIFDYDNNIFTLKNVINHDFNKH